MTYEPKKELASSIQDAAQNYELIKLEENVEIRDARTLSEAELKQLTILARLGFAGADVKKTLAHFAQSMVVIQKNINGEIIGMAVVGRHKGDFSARTGNKNDDLRVLCLNSAIVHPDYRRKGVATRMTAIRFEQISNDWFGLQDNVFVYSDFNDVDLMRVFEKTANKHGFHCSGETEGMLGSFGEIHVLPNEVELGITSTIITFMYGDKEAGHHRRDFVRIVLVNPDHRVLEIVEKAQIAAETAFFGKNSSEYSSGRRWYDVDSSKSRTIKEVIKLLIEALGINWVEERHTFDQITQADQWRIEQAQLVEKYASVLASIDGKQGATAFVTPIPPSRRVVESKDLRKR
ncbi:GNAT family N-acetyltransferase [Candidatus Woesebacteria bacterium]|nr:GNAT family N-acetyltransferase [Candidatus Woesebacteria bacterium]